MNNAEIIKGIQKTIEGLTTIQNALAGAETEVVAPAPVAEETQMGKFDRKQLESMKYNEFKKLAAKLGVKCTGTRDEIMERILALDIEVTDSDAVVSEPVEEVAVEAPVADAPAEEDKPEKSNRPAKGKRSTAKKVEEPTEDEFDIKAKEIAEDTPVEDIIDALKDVDVKATKRNYLTKLAQALRDGLIEVEDDDEDEDETDEVESNDTEDTADEVESDESDEEDEDEDDGDEDSDEDEDIEADSYFSQYDPEGFNDPKEMTDERKDAVIEMMDSILTDISEESLTMEDVETYIEEHATQSEIDLLGDEYTEDDELKLYMELKKRTIDDEGEEHDEAEDPYEVNGNDMCCGHKLKYVKKTKMFVCEHCGTEYQAE